MAIDRLTSEALIHEVLEKHDGNFVEAYAWRRLYLLQIAAHNRPAPPKDDELIRYQFRSYEKVLEEVQVA